MQINCVQQKSKVLLWEEHLVRFIQTALPISHSFKFFRFSILSVIPVVYCDVKLHYQHLERNRNSFSIFITGQLSVTSCVHLNRSICTVSIGTNATLKTIVMHTLFFYPPSLWLPEGDSYNFAVVSPSAVQVSDCEFTLEEFPSSFSSSFANIINYRA